MYIILCVTITAVNINSINLDATYIITYATLWHSFLLCNIGFKLTTFSHHFQKFSLMQLSIWLEFYWIYKLIMNSWICVWFDQIIMIFLVLLWRQICLRKIYTTRSPLVSCKYELYIWMNVQFTLQTFRLDKQRFAF